MKTTTLIGVSATIPVVVLIALKLVGHPAPLELMGAMWLVSGGLIPAVLTFGKNDGSEK